MKYNDVKRLMMAGLIASCAAFAAAAEAMPTAEPMVGMPSPLVEYPSVRDAWAVAGLPVYTPTLLPVGYAQKNVIVIDKSLAEIFYRNSDGKESLFRMAAGNADISGVRSEPGRSGRTAVHPRQGDGADGSSCALVAWRVYILPLL